MPMATLATGATAEMIGSVIMVPAGLVGALRQQHVHRPADETHFVFIDIESLPTGIVIPSAGQNSIPTA